MNTNMLKDRVLSWQGEGGVPGYLPHLACHDKKKYNKRIEPHTDGWRCRNAEVCCCSSATVFDVAHAVQRSDTVYSMSIALGARGIVMTFVMGFTMV